MKRVRWTASLGAVFGAAALALSAGGAQAADEGCKLVKVGELPVKFVGNEPLVPVTVNGKDGWFLIDTGASSSLMFGGAVKALGLGQFTADGMKFYGVGGAQDAKYTVVSEFALAGTKVKDMRFFVINNGGMGGQTGILGRDFLTHFDLEFDLANKTLRLFQAQHCGSRSLAYWSKDAEVADIRQDQPEDEYRLVVTINGKPVAAMLDSGATTSVITPDAANYAGVRKEDYAAGKAEYAGGIGAKKVAFRVATFDSVAVGEEQIKRARLQVADLFAENTETHTGSLLAHRMDEPTSMLLGADFLRSHRTMLAGSQHKLYFTYSGGPVFQVVGEAGTPKDPPGGADANTPAAK